jgi:predicted nucleic acid-binding protein
MPAPITAEVDYLVRSRGGDQAARSFLADLAGARFLVASLTPADHALALALWDRYHDLDAGLAHLSVVVLAARFETVRVLTFDQRHFRAMKPLQGGSFVLLPDDVDRES